MSVYMYMYMHVFRSIHVHMITSKKISIKINLATDKGNNRNEI